MVSKYLSNLSSSKRDELVNQLWQIQNGMCFISEDLIDLSVHKNDLDIDHIIPLKLSGKDELSNFALTFSSANRSKQASDLKLARILHKFQKIKKQVEEETNRSPNLDDILKQFQGSKYPITFDFQVDKIRYSLSAIGQNHVVESPVYLDTLSNTRYFFTNLPIEFVFHDDIINPRSIGQNISKLIDEFYSGNPQLHISLGWIDIAESKDSSVKIFDGQHKAAAQILLGARNIPIRIFINPDRDKLILTNFNAGTTLRQVAFDKSVQRHLGNTIYIERVERYQREHSLDQTNFQFSERDLVGYYKGESREVKRYILDSVRDSIIHDPENKLKDYVDFGGRGKEKPISYSSIEKTFYSFFIFQDMLTTSIAEKLEEGKNPRQLEKSQIVRLMNIIAEEILIGKFDFDIGTYQIESRLAKGERFADEHIRAYRMTKEELMWNWLKFINHIINQYFIVNGVPPDEKRLFQIEFPEPLWKNIKVFIKNLANLPLWVNYGLSNTAFGGKQNYDYWATIFRTGKNSAGNPILAEPINLIKMLQE